VPGLDAVIRDKQQQTLCLPYGCQLDFGGIAKGWAAHRVMLGLHAVGPALFSAGGDIAISGLRADGTPWKIGVDDPFRPGEYIEMLYVGAGGIATSGKDYRRWTRSGVPQHHIIDPRTAQPAATNVLTATVLAPDAMIAEAVAKAVLILGSEAGLEWLDADNELAGLLVLDDGQRLYSRNIDKYLYASDCEELDG
jgi:thiamine biosynthesis lipoprotein